MLKCENTAEKNLQVNFRIDEKTSNTIALLRVISAIGVLLVHINGIIWLGTFGEIAKHGAIGIRCFYILSGFLALHSFLTSSTTKEYWCKRLSRIIPIYYGWLLVIVLVHPKMFMHYPLGLLQSLLMLNYIAPPLASYEYCSMYLTGVLTIFMAFYVLIPFVAKWIKSLDAAFVGFWATCILCFVLKKVFFLAYGNICDVNVLEIMISYFLASFPYFSIGIMIYFGLKMEKKNDLLAYLLFNLLANQYFEFLPYEETCLVGFLVAVLLCFPVSIPKNCAKIIALLNRYTMGVYITQMLCFEVVCNLTSGKIKGYLEILLLIVTPCLCAVVVYHFVEVPGKKFIVRCFQGKPQNK